MAGCFLSILDFLLLCFLWGTWLQYNTEAQQASPEEKKVIDEIKKQNEEGKEEQQRVKNLLDRIAAEIERTYCTEITDISSNQTKNEGDILTLNCTAYGDPTPNITWTRVSNNSAVTFPLTISGKQDEGVYKCTADIGVGNAATRSVNVFVQNYRPINTNLSAELSYGYVVVNVSFNITCSAQANPPAKYRFYKENESFFNTTTGGNAETYTTKVGERVNQVSYICIPFNDYGDGPTKRLTLTVKEQRCWHFEVPRRSCKDILESGSSKGDGEYWIDPGWSGDTLKVYCDMTTDGGGWLQVSSYVMQSSTPPSQPPLSTSLLGISSNQMFITTSVMKELRTYLNFTQVRFHCKKQGGRTFHIATANNSKGDAAVQYFSNQRDDMPVSCGSYWKMNDDDSLLSRACDRWGVETGNYYVGKWGHGHGFNQYGRPEKRLLDHPAFVYRSSHWVLLDNRWECDDYSWRVYSGDFWKVFVR